jgi:hypothetical protein
LYVLQVGYGLDDNGTKRGWEELWACPKIPGIPPTEADGIFNEGEAGKQMLLDIRAKVRSTLDLK